MGQKILKRSRSLLKAWQADRLDCLADEAGSVEEDSCTAWSCS